MAGYSYFVGGALRRNSAKNRPRFHAAHIATSFGFFLRLALGFEKCELRAHHPNEGQINLCLVTSIFLFLNKC